MKSATVNRVVAQEQLVFDMRRESFRTQIRALEQLEAFLEKEAVSLEKQLEVHGIEIASVKTEYDMVEKLFKKGLTAAPRKLALERNLAQVDGDRLRLDSSLMRARQEISKTKSPSSILRPSATARLSTEMQKTQARLDELKSRMETSSNLLYETEVLAPQALSAEDGRTVEPVFKIVNEGNGSTSGADRLAGSDRDARRYDHRRCSRASIRKCASFPCRCLASIVAPTASADILAPERR